jgi:hypothetical protein
MQRFRIRKVTAGTWSEIAMTHASAEYIYSRINLTTAVKEFTYFAQIDGRIK